MHENLYNTIQHTNNYVQMFNSDKSFLFSEMMFAEQGHGAVIDRIDDDIFFRIF